MEFFATYVYPFALILFGAAIAGPLGIFGTQRWMEHRHHQADAIPEGLRELATQYECANWIENEEKRVSRKNQIFALINTFLANHAVKKQRLLDGGHLGRLIALAAAITQHPERGDAQLLLQIKSKGLPQGHAQYIFVDLVRMLRSRFDLTSAGERERLLVWAQEMPNKSAELQRRVREMQ